jgi:zinc/manganese transport system substrate-binding protein
MLGVARRESRLRRARSPVWLALVLAAVLSAGVPQAGCAAKPVDSTAPRTGIRVVAAENFWGSIASRLGGTRATVTSIVSNPNTDPHDYEPTVQDARAIAAADLVVYNGAGYDPWVQRILDANPDSSRIALSVGDLVGVPAGGNPHMWYSPDDVRAVIERTTAYYKKLDPTEASYFDERRSAFETKDLARYDALVSRIASTYAGVPIGASESVVAPLAEALGLKLLTPESFLNAVSEGTGPTASDKAIVDAQIRSRRIKVFIYNRQNSTPDVNALVGEAKAQGIPVVTVTETLEPATATFQDWQSSQLESIQQALRTATGR